MKKKLVMFVMAVVMAIVITACGGDNNSTPGAAVPPANNPTATAAATPAPAGAPATDPADAPPAQELVVLEFWTSLTGRLGEAVQEIVDIFNASHAGSIYVNVTIQGGYIENAMALQLALMTGTQPALAQLESSQVGEFGLRGVLHDLRPFFPQSELDDFVTGLMQQSWIGDALVSIPFNRSTPILYLNVDMLREAGLDPRGPQNWDEMRYFANALSDSATNTYGINIPIELWFISAGIFQQGGTLVSDDGLTITWNDTPAWTLAQFWQDMVAEGAMAPPFGAEVDAWDMATNDFLSQRAAMIMHSTANLAGFMEITEGVFELGTAFLPAGTQFGIAPGGANISVLQGVSEAELAASAVFLQYITSTELAAYFASITGYIPVRYSSVESDLIVNLFEQNPHFRTAFDQLAHAQSHPPVLGGMELVFLLQETMRSLLVNTELNVQDVIGAVTVQMQDVLDRHN